MDLDSNPYLDRVVGRMKADNAVQKLHSHWSARAERAVHRIGYWLDMAGLTRIASWYEVVTRPVHDWLAERQRAFLRRYL